MTFPPAVAHLRINTDERRVRLWLPLFLLWPLLLLIPIAAPVAIMIHCARNHWSSPGPRVWLTGPRLLLMICSLRGLEVVVGDPTSGVRVVLR